MVFSSYSYSFALVLPLAATWSSESMVLAPTLTVDVPSFSWKGGLWSSSIKTNRRNVTVCGLRTQKRPPSKCVLSKEAIRVIQELKLAKSSHKIEQVINHSLARLLKLDVLHVLAELQRQNHIHLSIKVFDFIREEAEYGHGRDTLLWLYSDMILLLGRNKMIEAVEDLFSQLIQKGLKPDTRIYNEMMGAYVQVGMTQKAMHMYHSIKASGCSPDRLTFTILMGMDQQELDMAATLSLEQDFPHKFIQQEQGQKEISRRGWDGSH